ncbi:MAG: pyruvate, water dikinase [Deltaproteobacteria bacterium]|nr:pyruvate, water dikinase [Deltaproteobacteria bacterium]
MRYETLRSLLDRNGAVLQLLNDLEADLRHMRHFDPRIRRPLCRILDDATLMAQELNLLSSNRYFEVFDVLFTIRGELANLEAEAADARGQPLAIPIGHEGSLDERLVGGKAAGVAALAMRFGDRVPGGFTVTTAGYHRFIEENRLHDRIRLLLDDLGIGTDRDRFCDRTETIRNWIRSADVPQGVREAIDYHASAASSSVGAWGWAVRSSAIGEDGVCSFAGQFDTLLRVRPEDLVDAYREVLASRFSERAVTYRIHCGVSEVETPMAVLFMPMVEARAAGVAASIDTSAPDSDRIIINAAPGLGDDVIQGRTKADVILMTRGSTPEIIEVDKGTDSGVRGLIGDHVLAEVGRLAMEAEAALGYAVELEWAVGDDGAVRLLQVRRLRPTAETDERSDDVGRRGIPILEGGMTVFPGRAEGPVAFLDPDGDPSGIPEGSVVLTRLAGPEIVSTLPRIAALIVEEGNPSGHTATLVREFSVPSLFRVGASIRRLTGRGVVSVDATRRRVFEGSRWPGIRERVLARLARGGSARLSGPLYERVMALNLTDPEASDFKVGGCRSVHDTIRFMHEMAIRSMFEFGDRHHGLPLSRNRRRLETDLPLKFHIIDLEGAVTTDARKVPPWSVECVPFKALWRGLSDERLPWPDRWKRMMRDVPAAFREEMLGARRGLRRNTDDNYLMVARDYLNLNARLEYHYSTVDAIVRQGDQNNHVHFEFRGGGASEENRVRRARFLEKVLRESGFGTDRSGSLVTAWLRRYPSQETEAALELLGRLMVCARQLDALMRQESDIGFYAEGFLAGDFSIFSW